MSMTDPIADMLTRIRNAHAVNKNTVDIPASSIKEAIAVALKESGMIREYKRIKCEPQDTLRVYLKYGPRGEQVISRLTRESKPGCRVFCKTSEIKPVLNGFGIGIYSTSRGILSDAMCRKMGVGGEYLFSMQ